MTVFESMTPAERVLRARAASHTSWANTPDRSTRTAPAFAAWNARFEKQVDPDRVMSPEARAKAAESARRAFYADMARKSAAARRKRATKTP